MSSYLNLTPWARRDLSADETAGLHARAAALGAFVSVTAARPGGPYQCYASDRAVRVSKVNVHGPLAVRLHALLDAFREERAGVEAEVVEILGADNAWAPDEILQVAAQTPGMTVRRA